MFTQINVKNLSLKICRDATGQQSVTILKAKKKHRPTTISLEGENALRNPFDDKNQQPYNELLFLHILNLAYTLNLDFPCIGIHSTECQTITNKKGQLTFLSSAMTCVPQS